MTSQEKKEWLNRYKSICRRILNKGEELENYRSMATKITQAWSDMPKAQSNENRIEVITEKIIEVESQINDELDELQSVRTEIENAINQIPNETYQELLERRYIQGQRWERIAIEMMYDYRYVLKLHGKALQTLHIEKGH
jgi:DNA repair exonuclease SbcCD ATPase subunit